MAGKGFEGGVEDVGRGMKSAARRARDLATHIDKIQMNWSIFQQRTFEINKQVHDLTKSLDALKKKSVFEGGSFEEEVRQINDLTKKIDILNKKLLVNKGAEKAAQLFDKLGKSLLKVHETIMTFGFGFLVNGIKRVYELQERWTRAIGEFNMKLGGMSAGLKGAQRAATQWEGSIRGLTDQFGVGLQMFADFTEGMSRMVEKGDQFSKFGLQLARGFNLGGEGAGRLARSMQNVGMSAGDGAKVMSELAEAANMMHVPVNMVAKDVAEANDYLVRFGKQGARSFVTAAAFARKFGMSMNDLRKSVERFDMLEDATTMAAKFNVAFGTAINGIDVLLEDDPAKRMETFRQSLMSQGQTFDRMSPKMRRLAADMLQVNETQLAAMLSTENAGVSYTKILEKQRAKEESEAKAKKQMEYALRKTAQTMFAFGAAFDRVTVAIAKAIRPLLEVLGLAKKNSPEWKSFGQVMGDIFATIEKFFNNLAKNPRWIAMMQDLATDLVRVGSALKEFVVGGGAVELVGKIVKVTRELYHWGRSAFEVMVSLGKKLMPILEFIYNNSKEIMLTWAGFKGLGAVTGHMNAMAAMMGGASGGTSTVGGKIGRAAGGLQKFGGGAIAGAGIGSLTGAGVEGSIGGAVGGLVGMLAGPLGSAVGAALGGFLATQGVKMFKHLTEKGESKEDILYRMRRENIAKTNIEAEQQFARNAEMTEFIDDLRMAKVKQVNTEFDKQITAAQGNKTALDELTVAHQQFTASLTAAMAQLDEFTTSQVAKAKEMFELQERELETMESSADKTLARDAAIGKGGKMSFENLMKYAVAVKKTTDAEEKLANSKALAAKAEAQILRAKLLSSKFEQEFANWRTGAGAGFANLSFEDQQMMFLNTLKTAGRVSEAEAAMLSDFYRGNIATKTFSEAAGRGTRFASGGVVARPTRALIGESGPEAVIPLKTLARGKGMMPSKFGGQAAKKLVNFAAGGGQQSQTQVVVTAGDVYLDGQKVGRHIVRSALAGRG